MTESSAMEGLSPQDRTRYALFHNAVVNCARAYNEEPTAARLRDLRAAEEALAEIKAELTVASGGDDAPPEERFKNRKQAHAWLQGEGYKVSRGKFYADCDAGALLVAPDGSLSKFRVLDYARKLRRPPLAPDLAAGDLAQEKLLWEVRRLKNEVRKQDLALRAEDRQWMAQADHERRISLLVIRLGELYAYHGHLAAPELCILAGGDPAAAGQVVDRLKVLLDAVFQDLRGAVMGEVFFGETDADDQPEGEDE